MSEETNVAYAIMRQEQRPCESYMDIDCVHKSKDNARAHLWTEYADFIKECDNGEVPDFSEYYAEEGDLEWYIFSKKDETFFVHLWVEATVLCP